MKLAAAVFLALGLCAHVQAAKAADAPQPLALASVFSNHMVLQRDARTPVWGTAAPHAKVAVSVDGKATATATADADGKWKLALTPHPAGGPVSVQVKSGDESVTLADVLFGDVWIAGGQSNMEWTVKDSDGADAALAAAANPMIRAIDVPNRPMDEPQASFETQGWQVAAPKTIASWPAVAYYFARDLQQELGVPIGILSCNQGGTPMEAWTSREALAAVPTFADDYDQAQELLKSNAKDAEGRPRMYSHHVPTVLFNGMLSPIIPYAVKGVVWYQGEDNSGRPAEYHELSKTMIADWRARFSQGDFPFLFVQLAAFEPGGETWPLLREAQTETLDVPRTGMAIAIDVGDRHDVHPRNKAEVGRRLALVARHVAYNDDQIEYSGPTYRDLQAEGDKLRVSFDHAAGLRSEGSELKGFEIAGADGRYVPATATIDGDAVILSAAGVTEPKSARYAWAAYPEATLKNAAGLPAAPFRSKK
ncbi:sialate O-acetylesterase [Lacipirellula sp.]|uniref:sialate O-acetylesterase n=1 Tax=Lacipirellula sp. TaxID=2691419 RepID=UPI003D0B8F4B